MKFEIESHRSKTGGASPKPGTSPKPGASPKPERVNSKYLDWFVFGSVSPRQQELFSIEEEPSDNQHLQLPAKPPPVYDVNKPLPSHPSIRRRLLGARRINPCVCASTIFVLVITLALAISIPIILR